jgi:hypothetical protein
MILLAAPLALFGTITFCASIFPLGRKKFGQKVWLSHPDASLEALASVATLREVKVIDTVVHKRFTQACAQSLHAILEEMAGVVVEADRQVPLELMSRFEAVVLEDSSTVALPNELVTCWQGCARNTRILPNSSSVARRTGP